MCAGFSSPPFDQVPSCRVGRPETEQAKTEFVMNALPSGDPESITVKPNWVRHQEDPAFPINALVTSSGLIATVLDACLEKYPHVRELTVGDVPLQNCEWDRLVGQAGIDTLIKRYEKFKKPRISFLDLRRECVKTIHGYHHRSRNRGGGDPRGYREVILDHESFLDPISDEHEGFRVSDYNPKETTSSHRTGFHRYLIAGSALDCDLFVNLPKVKTHQKAGMTGALKNLVGINGEKAYLVHYRRTFNGRIGDEFPPRISRAIVWQTRVRESLLDRSQFLFQMLRPGWQLLRRLSGIETRVTTENLARHKGQFFISGGSWHGNDTIWRMVYDLNRIIRYAPREGGRLASGPQRDYIAIADGLIAGEGNGPLQPLPIQLGVLLASSDPFLLDTVMAQTMGFDYQKIPMLRNATQFADPVWGAFNLDNVEVSYDGRLFRGIHNVPALHRFIPAPGWKDKIEYKQSEVLV